MKSIIEQASSVMKAIEKAWNQAEKPKEFSIKIFEEEERNFFGMSTKPAKVGIFFGDKPASHEKPAYKPRQEIKECRSSFSPLSPKAPEGSHKTRENKTQRTSPQAKPDHSRIPEQAQPTQPRVRAAEKPQQAKIETDPSFAKATEGKPRRVPATWNDTMVGTTHNWIKQTLSLMGLAAVDFNSEVAGKNLKLTFNTPLIADPIQEKQLFRSFAHLIMSSLRNQYKQEIKDLKVVLIRPE